MTPDGAEIDRTDPALRARPGDGLTARVLEALGAASGPELIARAAPLLGEALGAEAAIVGLLTADGAAVESEWSWRRGKPLQHLRYALAGTPCADILTGEPCVIRDGVAALFPGDRLLVELGARGYAGAPIRDRHGRTRGLIALVAQDALPEPQAIEPALRALADRIGVELQHIEDAAALRAANAALQQALDAHAASEARLADILSASSDWFWESDPQGRFTALSGDFPRGRQAAHDRFLGRTRAEVAATDGDPEHPFDWIAFEAMLAAGQPFRDMTYALRDDAGARRWTRISGAPVRDAAGRVTAWRGVAADVTAEREAELARAQAEQRLRDGIEAMGAGFALFDAEDRLVLCNSAYAGLADSLTDRSRLDGAAFETLVRGWTAGGLYADPLAREDPEAFIAARMARHRAADGAPFVQAIAGGRWVEIVERRTAEGGVALSRTDITARKLSEMRLRDGIEAMSGGFALFDAEDRLLLCNGPYRAVMDRTGDPRHRIGATFSDIVRATLENGLYPDPRAAADPEGFLAMRIARHRAADGRPFEIETVPGRWDEIIERRTSEGGIVLVRNDVTERRRSEARLRDGIEAMEGGFALFDAEDRLILCNAAAAAWLRQGPDGAPVLGASFAAILDANLDAGRYADATPGPAREAFRAQRLARHRAADGTPFELRTGDGRWVETVERRTSEGGIVLVARDITARRLSELRLRDGIEAMGAGYALFDAEDRLVLCNRHYKAFMERTGDPRHRIGATFEELVRATLDFGHYADAQARDAAEAFLARRLDHHRRADGTALELRLSDGSWVEIVETRTAEGGTALVRTDITARKLSELRLLGAIAAVPVGFIMCDASDRVLIRNRRYDELYPHAADAAQPGARFEDVVRACAARSTLEGCEPKDESWVSTRMRRHREPDEPFQHVTDEGRHVLVSETRTPDGGHVGVHVDVTALALLQRALDEARARAESALAARSRFLANMSHELRTPLNAVIGLSELMRVEAHGPLAPKYLEYAGLVKQAGEFLLSLIVDILDMSKIEAGRMELDRSPVDLGALAGEAAAMVRMQAQAKGLTLRLIPPEAAMPPVSCEPRRLKQVLLNLLSNAIKFTEAGSVSLSWGPDEGGALIVVEDTGIGMTAEEAARALLPFEQVRSIARRQYLEGTGLGLPLVKSLVELHGGALTLRSEPGRGTRVEVRLPA